MRNSETTELQGERTTLFEILMRVILNAQIRSRAYLDNNESKCIEVLPKISARNIHYISTNRRISNIDFLIGSREAKPIINKRERARTISLYECVQSAFETITKKKENKNKKLLRHSSPVTTIDADFFDCESVC